MDMMSSYKDTKMRKHMDMMSSYKDTKMCRATKQRLFKPRHTARKLTMRLRSAMS